MRIFHLTENILPGDAISGNVLALHRALSGRGVNGGIFTSYCYEKKEAVFPVGEMPALLEHEDLLLYQYSIGSSLTSWFLQQKCHKAIVYQNITPECFLRPYAPLLADAARRGREDLYQLSSKVDYAFASSKYSADELAFYGFSDVTVLPIFMEEERFQENASPMMKERLSDGKTNILFVGRKAPNKKIEDILLAVDYYAYVSARSCRLILAGDDSLTLYCDKIKELISRLKNVEVMWLGKIAQNELVACYQKADLFLCMSEHEGFCVPLLECMYYDVPVLAYSSTAVAETLGDFGITFSTKNFRDIAKQMDIILSDKKQRDEICARGKQRFAHFNAKRSCDILLNKVRSAELHK